MSEIKRIQKHYRDRDSEKSLGEFWSLANPVAVHLMQERERVALAGLHQSGLVLPETDLLDVGCGFGREFGSYIRWGANPMRMVGVDVSKHRIDAARSLACARVELISGTELPFPSGSFDFVIQSVVFSSIIDRTTQQALAQEMLRVLRPKGWLLWYDAARSGNRDKHFCDMPKARVEALFPGVVWEWRHLTTHLGLLKRVNMLFGSRGMQALDLLGVCKTHLLGWGQKL